jgi:hypothetical protein
MKNYLLNWIWAHANWIILVLFAIGIFVAFIASNIALPLALIVAAVTVAVIRHWQAIKSFDSWALDEWLHTRLDSIGISEWSAPYRAAELYCNPTVVKVRNEAAAEMNSIMMELIRSQNGDSDDPAGPGLSTRERPHRSKTERGSDARLHERYDAAQIRHNQCNTALAREMIVQLAHGNLLAKGLLVENDIAQSERIVPSSRWRVLRFDISKAEASGQGLHYTGIVIGKKPVVAKKSKPPIRQS